jgi:hypothetical protein
MVIGGGNPFLHLSLSVNGEGVGGRGLPLFFLSVIARPKAVAIYIFYSSITSGLPRAFNWDRP